MAGEGQEHKAAREGFSLDSGINSVDTRTLGTIHGDQSLLLVPESSHMGYCSFWNSHIGNSWTTPSWKILYMGQEDDVLSDVTLPENHQPCVTRIKSDILYLALPTSPRKKPG